MIAVTGADGFVGRALCQLLAAQARPFRAVCRTARPGTVGIGDIGPATDWRRALAGVGCVVHLAARVHQMRETGADLLSLYRYTNVEGTRALARQAQAAGVRRLVYVSSIKVNGERTAPSRPFRPDDPPAPVDPYGQSKREAEDALRAFAAETGMELVIVRPPLVYGAGVGANFRALIGLVRCGLPLPFAGFRNRRSLIAVENLADLLVRCAVAVEAAGQTFLCSDGEDLSTSDLLRVIAEAENRTVRLFPAPAWGLRTAGNLVGRRDAIGRVTESLQIDMSTTCLTLGWRPPFTVREAMRRAAAQGWATPPISHASEACIE